MNTPKLTPRAEAEHLAPCAPIPGGYRVYVTWQCDTPGALDRTNGTGYLLGQDATLAARLVRAINAGAVFTSPELRRDVNGRTYVSASRQVLGRTANADLTRLGF